MKGELSILAYNAGYQNPTDNYYHWLCDLQKWLREEHEINVHITFSSKEKKYGFIAYSNGSYVLCVDKYKTYEQALEEGLKKALEKL